ncbi:unnamed protein product [Urochloa humidicola]
MPAIACARRRIRIDPADFHINSRGQLYVPDSKDEGADVEVEDLVVETAPAAGGDGATTQRSSARRIRRQGEALPFLESNRVAAVEELLPGPGLAGRRLGSVRWHVPLPSARDQRGRLVPPLRAGLLRGGASGTARQLSRGSGRRRGFRRSSLPR